MSWSLMFLVQVSKTCSITATKSSLLKQYLCQLVRWLAFVICIRALFHLKKIPVKILNSLIFIWWIFSKLMPSCCFHTDNMPDNSLMGLDHKASQVGGTLQNQNYRIKLALLISYSIELEFVSNQQFHVHIKGLCVEMVLVWKLQLLLIHGSMLLPMCTWVDDQIELFPFSCC